MLQLGRWPRDRWKDKDPQGNTVRSQGSRHDLEFPGAMQVLRWFAPADSAFQMCTPCTSRGSALRSARFNRYLLAGAESPGLQSKSSLARLWPLAGLACGGSAEATCRCEGAAGGGIPTRNRELSRVAPAGGGSGAGRQVREAGRMPGGGDVGRGRWY